jgi:hypothetical protein
MESRLHLAGTVVPEPLKWPSIAAASQELRRPRHLHAVPSPVPALPTPRVRSATSPEPRRQ